MKFKHAYIHSKHRTSGTTSDFIHEHQRPIENVMEICGYGISIINSFHNIHSGNNRLTITDTGGTANIDVPVGFYSPEELRRELQTLLNNNATLSETYTLTLDETSKAFVFAIGTTNVFSIDGSCSIAKVIGIMDDASSFIDTVSKIISDGVWNLSGRETIYVCADNLPIANEVNKRKHSILLRVDMDKALNEVVHFRIQNPEYHFITLKNQFDFQKISLSLRDENMNLLDNNGVDWCLEILFKCE